MAGWTKAKRSAAAKKAARTRKRNAGNKGVTPTVEKKEKSHHVVMVEAGYKSWLTRRRNFISKKLFRKVYKDLSSKRERDNVDARLKEEYELEYGTDAIEIHTDAIGKGDKVLIVDDLLATGGTAKATGTVVENLQGEIISYAFLIVLTDLKGDESLSPIQVFKIIEY